MDTLSEELPDDKPDNPFQCLGHFLQRGVPAIKLAHAIKKHGVYTHDQFDRRVVADAKARANALAALGRQHEWEVESQTYKRTTASPVDEWGDAWHVPYARSGWPANKCPNFETVSPGAAVEQVAGKLPAHVSANNWEMVVQTEAARLWTALRTAGANPTKNALQVDLATWCRRHGVKTKTGINPSAKYIYRHVLSKWTPPAG